MIDGEPVSDRALRRGLPRDRALHRPRRRAVRHPAVVLRDRHRAGVLDLRRRPDRRRRRRGRPRRRVGQHQRHRRRGRRRHADRARPHAVPRRHGRADRHREGRDHQARRGRDPRRPADRGRRRAAAPRGRGRRDRRARRARVRRPRPAGRGRRPVPHPAGPRRRLRRDLPAAARRAPGAERGACALAAVEAFFGADADERRARRRHRAGGVRRRPLARPARAGPLGADDPARRRAQPGRHDRHPAGGGRGVPVPPAGRRRRGDGRQGRRRHARTARTGRRRARRHPELAPSAACRPTTSPPRPSRCSAPTA